MNGLSGRARLLIAVLVAAVGGGLAAGIVLARGENTAANGPAGVVARGTFKSVGWGTRGTATIVRDASGRLKLRLGANFLTHEAPETYVYLAKYEGSKRTLWKEVGELKSGSGSQAYNLPAATPVGVTVEIYCAKCNRTSGIAALRPLGASA